MSSTTDVAHSPTAFPVRSSSRLWLRYLVIAGVCALIVILVGTVLCAKYWPFSQKEIVEDLAEASDSKISIQGFHPTYFPVPGCVVYGIVFRHGQDQKELVTIQKLRIRGSYTGILRHYVPSVIAEGTHVFIPALGTKTTFNTQHSNIEIGEIVANGTLIEFASSDPKGSPLIFDIHDALLTGVRWASPIGYHLKFHNPNPPGEIAVAGKFGAWTDGHPDDTPLSGEFTFDKANLGIYDGIGGLLNAKGKFEGTLKHIDVSGATDTPDFEVKESGKKVDLRTQFQAYVDGRNGDTFLNHVDAKFGRTTVAVDGSIAHAAGRSGKLTKVHMTSHNGRVEDLLGLFISDPHSPMAGPVFLDARAEFPSGNEGFLDRLHLSGQFVIGEGTFTHPDTQLDVDKLSAGARGKSKDAPDNVVTDLRGAVDMRRAIADFSDLDFKIPGAHSKLHGTFNVENQRVNLHGNLRVDTSISNTSTGFKSFMLKVLDPLFKKRKKGEIVPVHIMGTYQKPDIGLDLNKNDNKKPNQKKPDSGK